MSNDLWRWADPEGQQRGVRLDELRAALAGGHIAPNTPVWRAGWQAWQAAHEVPELTSSALSAANGVVPNIPPPPLAMVAMQHEFEAKGGGSFSPPALGEPVVGGEEPPPPPAYVPLPVKANSIPPPAGSSGRLPQNGPVPSSPPGPPAPANYGPQVSGLKTTLGLPPPPELAAMAAAHKAAAASPDPMIEELSGSMLLDDSAPHARPGAAALPTLVGGATAFGSAATVHAPPGGVPLPPPTDPVLRTGDEVGPGDEDLGEDDAGLPARRPQLTAVFDDLAAIKAGRAPKNKLLLAVLAIVGLSVLISLVALVVSAFRGKPSELPSKSAEGASASSSSVSGAASSAPSSKAAEASSASASATATSATKDPPKTDPSPSGAGLGDCVLAGEAHVIAPRAFIQSGVEAVSVPGAIALGFAINPRDSQAVTVDAATLGVVTTVKARALGGDARRVSPLFDKGKLTLVPEVDRKGDKLQGRRVVATSPAIDVGVAEGAIVWAPHGQNTYAKLFALEGEGAVEALRAVPLGNAKGIALAFRRGNAIYVGTAKGEAALAAEGSLGKLAGLGQVGSPTLATSGDAILVAWSDRATAQEPWQVRFAKLTAGGAPDAPRALALPEGGPGTQAMSPSVAGLGAGRFAMTWSEGTPGHQVRAVSLGVDGAASGAAIALSAVGVNAGQPQIAIGTDGRGVVAFLAAKGKAFELQATPITCAAK